MEWDRRQVARRYGAGGAGLLLLAVAAGLVQWRPFALLPAADEPHLAGAPARDVSVIWDEGPTWHNSEPRDDGSNGFWFPMEERRVHGKVLPRRVVQCYTDWNQCDDSVLAAAQGGGCNVLVWAFINFCRAMPRAPVQVPGGPDVSCFRRVAAQLERSGYDVVHLASVGGWNQPHPEGIAAPEAFAAFDVWNREVVADSVITGFQGFDGVDWDIEGADSAAR